MNSRCMCRSYVYAEFVDLCAFVYVVYDAEFVDLCAFVCVVYAEFADFFFFFWGGEGESFNPKAISILDSLVVKTIIPTGSLDSILP